MIAAPAGAWAVDAAAEGEPDGELAAAEAAGLADVDAEASGLGESAWVWVAGGLLAGAGPPDACELLLHAVAVRASTARVAVAARVLSCMAAPNCGRARSVPVLVAKPPPVTAV